ncbi:DUF4314 domain-containing protein [Clostridiaceae bacterium]|nr:DUF4314 domain-containing protein [Clostridiaceae bacterium]
MTFDKVKVDALRKQYPPGTRIKLEHMDDPYPVEPGTGGTVRFIDDLGQVGVDFDNGRSLSLIPGEDSFSIQHLQNLNFYMPMTVNAEWVDEWGDYINDEPEKLTDQESIGYADAIRDAILKERMPEESERGLMIYCDKDDSIGVKVQSLRFDVDVRQGKLWGVAECELREPLNASEMSNLIDAIVGQASDGFGEGFEQRGVKIPDNGMIYASLWSADKTWTIQTEQERFSPSELPEVCLSTLPSTGEIICIKRGESGYYPSEWETGNAEKNRQIVDYHNQRRGITPAQEEAMVGGSMFGWDTPAADPSRYEKLETTAPSMSL